MQNTIERVVLLYNDEILKAHHITFLLNNPSISHDLMGAVIEPGSILLPDNRLPIEEIEKEIVSKAMKKFQGNKTKVAEYLDISRSALRSKQRKL